MVQFTVLGQNERLMSYFGQIVVQEMGGDGHTQGKEILDILYATEEGFAVPEEDIGEF